MGQLLVRLIELLMVIVPVIGVVITGVKAVSARGGARRRKLTSLSSLRLAQPTTMRRNGGPSREPAG